MGRAAPLLLMLCVCMCLACDFKPTTAGAERGDPEADFCEATSTRSFSFDNDLDGELWNAPSGSKWRVADGWLLGKPGNQNRALWLTQPLPDKVRIEFDAKSSSEDGDLKVEVFGDGQNHESGYILIFGGWKNSINAIARLDEHGSDRLEGAPDVKVEPGKTYHMAVVRTGRAVRWYLGRGEERRLLLEYDDSQPLKGPRHQHFAFNNWNVPVHFDNLDVHDLSTCR